MTNPLLNLGYEPALEKLGEDYFDTVAAAEFPEHHLRFRSDPLLIQLGLDPLAVSDADFIEAFGQFRGREPFLALRYHGYQFGEYNPSLGDGRGFLYGQVRGCDGELYDFGTKGSGTTPYSRHGDGRLTLKGGLREVLAAEALHHLGVRTSRALSLVETGEALFRGDEPSPTRSSVLVRMSRSHIRFGTFERLHYFKRKDLIQKLLDHVIDCYYPELASQEDRYARFYAALVERVALLTAQWMSVGFCHAVLNTDNMSITGESFDYGPYAFIDRFDPQFTAAYFDHYGRYSYGNQPLICRMNLEALQYPLAMVVADPELEAGLGRFDDLYQAFYQERMLLKLGFVELEAPLAPTLLRTTLLLLETAPVGYHDFFTWLTRSFSPAWQQDPALIATTLEAPIELLLQWRELYHKALGTLTSEALPAVGDCLKRHNPVTVLLRPRIEAVWEAISSADDWQAFYRLVNDLQNPYRVQANG